MRWYRILPFLFTGVGIFLLTGALRGPLLSSVARLPEPPPELARLDRLKPDNVATALVHQALAHIQKPASAWLQTAVWLRSHHPDLKFSGDGVYLKAPGKRFRLEVRISREDPAQHERTLLTLSDGRVRWQTLRTGIDNYHDVKRLRLEDEHNAPVGLQPGQLVCGPEPLLRSLLAHFSWVHSTSPGPEVTVTGTWHEGIRPHIVRPNTPWPAALPRACRLVIRGKERWPARLEWWGPYVEQGPNRLLLEMEFRDPVWGREIPELDCLRLFTFHPGTFPVQDLTPSATN